MQGWGPPIGSEHRRADALGSPIDADHKILPCPSTQAGDAPPPTSADPPTLHLGGLTGGDKSIETSHRNAHKDDTTRCVLPLDPFLSASLSPPSLSPCPSRVQRWEAFQGGAAPDQPQARDRAVSVRRMVVRGGPWMRGGGWRGGRALSTRGASPPPSPRTGKIW